MEEPYLRGVGEKLTKMDEHGRIWTNTGEPGRTWKSLDEPDLGGRGRWMNMDEHGRTISEGVGEKVNEHGRTWTNMDEHKGSIGHTSIPIPIPIPNSLFQAKELFLLIGAFQNFATRSAPPESNNCPKRLMTY